MRNEGEKTSKQDLATGLGAIVRVATLKTPTRELGFSVLWRNAVSRFMTAALDRNPSWRTSCRSDHAHDARRLGGRAAGPVMRAIEVTVPQWDAAQ